MQPKNVRMKALDDYKVAVLLMPSFCKTTKCSSLPFGELHWAQIGTAA